jgi:DNA-binding PadR family transcriptional regulator
VTALEREIVNTMYQRFLKEFMDVLIISKIREGETSGYDVISYFHQRFDFLISPGTVYSVLYSMERDGLIKARDIDRKRVYTLTPKGQTMIKTIQESGEILDSLFAGVLKGRNVRVEVK